MIVVHYFDMFHVAVVFLFAISTERFSSTSLSAGELLKVITFVISKVNRVLQSCTRLSRKQHSAQNSQFCRNGKIQVMVSF